MVTSRLRSVMTLFRRTRPPRQQPVAPTTPENGHDRVEEDIHNSAENLQTQASIHDTTSVSYPCIASAAHIKQQSIHNTIVFFGVSDAGLKRTNNEDHFIVADLTRHKSAVEANRIIPKMTHQVVGPQGTLLAVADGLGGYDNGEIASHVAVEALAQCLFHQGQDKLPVAQQLSNAIQEAHSMISHHIVSTPGNHSMSSTLTAVHIGLNKITVAQVGDSRAYMFSNAILTQLTEDQTFVQMMLRKGLITSEEALTHPERHVILQALGQGNSISPTIQHFPFRYGDRILLCSDGLSSYVSHEKIEVILNEEADETVCCQRLLEAAYTGGGGDNITILLARLLITPVVSV